MVGGASSSPYCDPWWWERSLTSTAVCRACNGYYGPCFSEPVCATCHAFLYANDLDQEINLQIMSAEEMDPDEDREATQLAAFLDPFHSDPYWIIRTLLDLFRSFGTLF